MLLSFSFNGTKKDYIIAERGKRRSAIAPLTRNILSIPGLPGGILQNTETEVRTIEQPIIIKGVDRFNVRKLEEDLAAWLVTKEPKELIFDDEPDRIYYALVSGEIEIEDMVNKWGRSVIRFVCLDPYKYKGTIQTDNFATNPTNVINTGTVETYPIFRADIIEPVPNIDILSGDSYMRVGQPYTVEQTPTEAETIIFHDTLDSLVGWGSADYVDNGHVSGEIVSENNSFLPKLFGQVIEPGVWQGPSLKKSFSEPIQDFRMDVELELYSMFMEGTGMIEIYLLDVSNNVVGKIGIEDRFMNSDIVHFKAQAGSALDASWKFLWEDDRWANFTGLIRLEREGLDWYAYLGMNKPVAAGEPISGEYIYQKGSKRNVHFYDAEAKHNAPVAQVQISFRNYPDTPKVPMYVNRVRVWRKNKIDEEKEVPFIVEAGDLVEINHQENDIKINGVSRPDLKDFGAQFFPLTPGENILGFFPADKMNMSVEWRERFL